MSLYKSEHLAPVATSGERSPGVVSPSGRKASASLRAKQGRSSDKEEPSTGDAAIRTRVAVFWPGDRVYYKVLTTFLLLAR